MNTNKEETTRIYNYIINNKFSEKYIIGIANDLNLYLRFDGKTIKVPFDKLKDKQTEEGLQDFIRNYNTDNVNEEKESLNQNHNENIKIEDNKGVSLEDVKILTEFKNLLGLNNIIKSFAVNDAGSIDINIAKDKVMENTAEEAIKCAIAGLKFSTNLKDYSVDGKYNGTILKDLSNLDEIKKDSFNNITVYINAAKQYGQYWDVEEIKEEYEKKLNEKLREKHTIEENEKPIEILETNNPNPSEINENTNNINKTSDVNNETNKTLVYTNPANLPKAGFADIFVLTLIVLVYAAILVNLIMKLS